MGPLWLLVFAVTGIVADEYDETEGVCIEQKENGNTIREFWTYNIKKISNLWKNNFCMEKNTNGI